MSMLLRVNLCSPGEGKEVPEMDVLKDLLKKHEARLGPTHAARQVGKSVRSWGGL